MKKHSQKTKKLTSNLRKQFNNYTFKGETNTLPSQTVPDLTLSVKQLLINHSRGISSDISINEPMYFDTEIPIIDDITDLDAFREDLKAREKALSLKIKDENDKLKAKQQKEFEDSQNDLKKQTEKLEVKPKGENL